MATQYLHDFRLLLMGFSFVICLLPVNIIAWWKW